VPEQGFKFQAQALVFAACSLKKRAALGIGQF
jgi:hypothetical protein